ncbi:MAG: hypothetical protein KBH94_04665 [Caldisericia bacterium]|nr:hypothetical protein [Caldisericia bacterium]
MIKTVLLNITWDGENLHYDYNSPFDLIVKLNESTDWGRLKDIIMNLETTEIYNLEKITHLLNKILNS